MFEVRPEAQDNAGTVLGRLLKAGKPMNRLQADVIVVAAGAAGLAASVAAAEKEVCSSGLSGVVSINAELFYEGRGYQKGGYRGGRDHGATDRCSVCHSWP